MEVKNSSYQNSGFINIDDEESQSNQREYFESRNLLDKKEVSTHPLLKQLDLLGEIMESKRVQYIIVILVIIDTLCSLAEAFVDFTAEKDGNATTVVGQFLHVVTVTILSMFVIELLVKAICYRRNFISAGNLFDTTIVIIDVAMEFATEGFVRDLLELVIVLRMWRVGELVLRIIQAIQSKAKQEVEKEQEKTFYAEQRLKAVDEQLQREHALRTQVESKLKKKRGQMGTFVYTFDAHAEKKPLQEQFQEFELIIQEQDSNNKWKVYKV